MCSAKYQTKTPYPIKMKYSVIAKNFAAFISRSDHCGSSDSDCSAGFCSDCFVCSDSDCFVCSDSGSGYSDFDSDCDSACSFQSPF